MFDCVIVKYGEIALKGLNKPFFEKKLEDNLRKSIKTSYKSIKKIESRFVIELEDNSDTESLKDSLKKVFGLVWFAFCYECEPDIERIKENIKSNFTIKEKTNARVTAKRSHKNLPFTSSDVNNKIGEFLLKEFKVKINLENPELEVFIELISKSAFIFTEKIRGLGGLPVGFCICFQEE